GRYPGFYLDMVVTPLFEVISSAMKKGGDHRERKTYDDFNEFFWAPQRSWLHPLITLNRIFEWHAVTFTLLAAWAYSNLLQWTFAFTLQWTSAFTLQVGSFVFWEITFFGILWTALEVWTLFPAVKISDPSVCGYVLRLLAGVLILTYQ
ncbi:hypothetical protein B484DRAFT_437833, partial [Ochromonadaceae sp. CCMP2298]